METLSPSSSLIIISGLFSWMVATLEHAPLARVKACLTYLRSLPFLIRRPMPIPGSNWLMLIFFAVDLAEGK